MTYQKVTGSLLASGYNKLGTQEAMNGMYITEKRNVVRNRKWASTPTVSAREDGCFELYERSAESFEGGGVI